MMGNGKKPARRLSGQTLFLAAAIVLSCLVVGFMAWSGDGVSGGRGPAGDAGARRKVPPVYGYQVVKTYPHDPNAYCQGLTIDNGILYEGTGTYGRSSLRRVDLESGKVLQILQLDAQLFGEGIAVWNDRIVQLTWRNQVGFVYDKQSLKRESSFRYASEGWGLTHDGRHLIMSDGSAMLCFLDPETFKVVRRIKVHSQGAAVTRLNELEYVEGEVYANIWGADYIARISPKTGEVLGWIDLSGLLKPQERPDQDAVLNGIAFDRKEKRLFVTGKNWPKLFEIRVVPKT
jgi:glutamine cyclotransferase